MTVRLDAAKSGTPVVLGVPFDANSSWLRGAAGAPPIIRVALHSISSNSWTETGVNLGVEGSYCDAGDLKFTFQEPFPAIETKVGELLDKGLRPVCLGRFYFSLQKQRNINGRCARRRRCRLAIRQNEGCGAIV